MGVKIDTKEKFHVITVQERELSDNIAADLSQLANSLLETDIKNLVLKLPSTEIITREGAEKLVLLQQTFYEKSASFVICEMQKPVEEKLDEWELLEVMNITPTESEAWDIVQMEEIERELLESDDVEFNSHGE